MSEALIPAISNLPSNEHATDEHFKELVTSSGFLPRLQLFGGNSGAVTEGKIPLAHFGTVTGKDDVIDAGEEVNLIPISMRFKAVRIGGEDGAEQFFNPKSDEFLSIIEDSKKADSGCMYGPEFLVWLPDQKVFATYFMNSASARREAPALKGLIGQGATLRAKLIKNKKYKWHAPQVVVCSDPLETPTEEDVITEAKKFANPDDSSANKATEEEQAATGRAR